VVTGIAQARVLISRRVGWVQRLPFPASLWLILVVWCLCRLEDAQLLCSSLYRRREDVTDFCVRVYEGRRCSFVSDAFEEVDRRCAQVISSPS